jgi:predicted DNA-binding ribbon-helix-helix protein
MKSTIRKRSVRIRGQKTSVSLEEEFWVGLCAIATAGGNRLANAIRLIDQQRFGWHEPEFGDPAIRARLSSFAQASGG